MTEETKTRSKSPGGHSAGRPIAVGVKPAASSVGRRAEASPHLLDLKTELTTTSAGKKTASDDENAWARSKLARLIDEQSRLQDLKARSLSVRPRGWRDFPPPEAHNVRHALLLTVKQFLSELPLADLTIVTVIRLTAAVIWAALTAPFRLARRLSAIKKRSAAPAAAPDVEPKAAALLTALPLAATKAGAPARSAAQKTDARLERPLSWKRSLAAFAGVAAVMIAAIVLYGSVSDLSRNRPLIMEKGSQGMQLIKTAAAAAGDRRFDDARASFDAAADSFSEARRALGPLGNLAASAAALVPARSSATAADPVLTAGRELAVGGSKLAGGLAGLDGLSDLVAKVDAVGADLRSALPHLELAAASLGRVDPEAVPAEYRATLTTARSELPKLAGDVRKAASVAELLKLVMGVNGTKRYLVIFENNAELRPTGGFMGSYALIDVNRGKVRKVEVPGGGSYDLQGALRPKLVSPQPLHLINPDWEFQDANWFADFPTSAQKIVWFYEQSGGPTTDGVIAVTMSFAEKLLEATGPIEMPEYGKTIDARNFYFETQKAVELEYDKTKNRPKQFIADLAPKLLQKLTESDRGQMLQIASSLDSALSEKQLLFWFKDPEAQSRIADLGWAGELKATDGDYLNIVHTNIAGQKTDLVMSDAVDHSVKVMADGSAVVTLTLKRTHGGVRNALFSGVRNVDYVRFYVPSGSSLVEASGFESPDVKLFKIPDDGRSADPMVAEQENSSKIDRRSGMRIFEESGKTVFGGWLQTDPGETSTATVVYKLPPGTVKLDEIGGGAVSALYNLVARRQPGRSLTYSLLVQKQPGANPASLTSSIDFPRGYRLVWQQPQRTEDERGRWTAATTVAQDVMLGAVARTD